MNLKKISSELGVKDPLPFHEDEEGYDISLDDVGLMIINLATAREYLSEARTALYIGEDRDYREWRAKMTEAVLTGDPKLAEYKVNAKVNADPQFHVFKTEIASRRADVEALEGFVEILGLKVRLANALLSE